MGLYPRGSQSVESILSSKFITEEDVVNGNVLGSERVLFGPRDVDCDSAHAATTLSLPVVAFEMLGSMWQSA